MCDLSFMRRTVRIHILAYVLSTVIFFEYEYPYLVNMSVVSFFGTCNKDLANFSGDVYSDSVNILALSF